MARPPARSQLINTKLQKGQKSTQRERLVAGMIVVANRDGYAGVNVSAVIAEAGVSRPTFYEYFADKDACFLASTAEIQERVLAAVRAAVAGDAPERAAHAAIGALIAFATSEASLALFLMNETMAAGPGALDARDEGITRIARVIEQSYAQVGTDAAIPDVPTAMVIGGVYRWLSARLRRGERNLAAQLEDLLRWISAYEQPAGQSRWRTLKPAPPPARSPYLPKTAMRAPSPLPPGRPRVSEQEVAENHRLRIMFAAALLAEEKGYAATTIADITKRAGVDARAFYALFAEKQDAFMAVHELGFQDVMAVTAGAFFAGATWPERSWEAGRAFTQFLEKNPTIAHVGFVEAYAVGPAAVQRVEDSHVAFTIFLQEGFQYRPQSVHPSRVALELIITTIFETVYHQARASGKPKLSGLLPHITHVWLTPFLGPGDTNAFIDGKLRAEPKRGRGKQ